MNKLLFAIFFILLTVITFEFIQYTILTKHKTISTTPSKLADMHPYLSTFTYPDGTAYTLGQATLLGNDVQFIGKLVNVYSNNNSIFADITIITDTNETNTQTMLLYNPVDDINLYFSVQNNDLLNPGTKDTQLKLLKGSAIISSLNPYINHEAVLTSVGDASSETATYPLAKKRKDVFTKYQTCNIALNNELLAKNLTKLSCTPFIDFLRVQHLK